MAILFAAADPIRAIPSLMAGATVTGGLSLMFNIGLRAPHGGGWLLYLLAIIGSVISALLQGVFIAAAEVFTAS